MNVLQPRAAPESLRLRKRGTHTQVIPGSYSHENSAYKMAERAAIYAVQARQASVWRNTPDARPVKSAPVRKPSAFL
jgi:hypothetical protein